MQCPFCRVPLADDAAREQCPACGQSLGARLVRDLGLMSGEGDAAPVDDDEAIRAGGPGDGIDENVDDENVFLASPTAWNMRVLNPVAAVGDGVQAMLADDAVLCVRTGVDLQTLALSPFERFVLREIDGRRPVARIRSKMGISEADLTMALALLVQKKAVALVAVAEVRAGAAPAAVARPPTVSVATTTPTPPPPASDVTEEVAMPFVEELLRMPGGAARGFDEQTEPLDMRKLPFESTGTEPTGPLSSSSAGAAVDFSNEPTLSHAVGADDPANGPFAGQPTLTTPTLDLPTTTNGAAVADDDRQARDTTSDGRGRSSS